MDEVRENLEILRGLAQTWNDNYEVAALGWRDQRMERHISDMWAAELEKIQVKLVTLEGLEAPKPGETGLSQLSVIEGLLAQ